MQEDDVDRFREIMSAHGLRPSSGYVDGLSSDVPEEERAWVSIDYLVMEEDVDRVVDDEMVAGRCTKQILADEDYALRMRADMADEEYNPALFYLGLSFHVVSINGSSERFKCFLARLRHPSADLVLRWTVPDRNCNIVHVICASNVGYAPGSGVPFTDDLVEWQRKKDVLVMIAERVSREPGLMRRLFGSEGLLPPVHPMTRMTPRAFLNWRWNQYKPRLVDATPAQTNACFQIAKSMADLVNNVVYA